MSMTVVLILKQLSNILPDCSLDHALSQSSLLETRSLWGYEMVTFYSRKRRFLI